MPETPNATRRSALAGSRQPGDAQPGNPQPGNPQPGNPAIPQTAVAAFVAAQVVPRLVVARAKRGAVEDGSEPQEAEVDGFVRLLLAPGIDGALDHVDTLGRGGPARQAACLGLFASAAARLRVLWREDACDLAALALGLGRLRLLLRRMDDAADPAPPRGRQAAVLLVTVPGDQPTFEAALLACLFRQRAWAVHDRRAGSVHDLVAAVRAARYDVAGIWCGDGLGRDRLAGFAWAVRRGASNPAMGVLVAGTLEAARSATLLGADAVVADLHDALAVAERWRRLMCRA